MSITRKREKVDTKRKVRCHRVGSLSWAASELGCSVPHLSLVKRGHRKSIRLTRRYRTLMERLEEGVVK
jgi:hypothetical protein